MTVNSLNRRRKQGSDPDSGSDPDGPPGSQDWRVRQPSA
jgi:hypothetical protein